MKTVPVQTDSALFGRPSRVRPPWMKLPRPSPPTSTAIAAMPTVSSVETLMPGHDHRPGERQPDLDELLERAHAHAAC